MSEISEHTLVIGASSDIGLALVSELLNQGQMVYAHYNQNPDGLKRLKEKFSDRLHLLQADLRKLETVGKLIDDIEDAGIDGIVQLAASRPRNKRLKELDWADFSDELTLQVGSTHEIMKRLLPKMAKAKRGKVVFMLTSYTLGVPPAALAHYVSTKYALLGYAKSIASEYSTKGLNINSISPSMIETKFLENIPDKMVELTAQAHPLKRLASVDDIVPVILLLLSDSSGYMNGVNIPVTGGSVF